MSFEIQILNTNENMCSVCRDVKKGMKEIYLKGKYIPICKECRMELYSKLHDDLLYNWEGQ